MAALLRCNGTGCSKADTSIAKAVGGILCPTNHFVLLARQIASCVAHGFGAGRSWPFRNSESWPNRRAADIVGHHHVGAANNLQARKQRDRNLSGQPFVTTGGGALPLPLPMPAQPATLTATRVATKAMSSFFIGVPLSSRHAMHTSCLAAPLVARCRQWFTPSVDSGAVRRGLCP
jgi:hypothetical protein